MSTPFCNNLRLGDLVLHNGRAATVCRQPRESSEKVEIKYAGKKTPQYVSILELRLVVDGKAEDVPPCDGIPPNAPALKGDTLRQILFPREGLTPAQFEALQRKEEAAPKRMSDPELIALAAVANIEAVLMAGDNASRARQDMGPAWADGHGFMPAGTALREELRRRNLLS